MHFEVNSESYWFYIETANLSLSESARKHKPPSTVQTFGLLFNWKQVKSFIEVYPIMGR